MTLDNKPRWPHERCNWYADPPRLDDQGFLKGDPESRCPRRAVWILYPWPDPELRPYVRCDAHKGDAEDTIKVKYPDRELYVNAFHAQAPEGFDFEDDDKEE